VVVVSAPVDCVPLTGLAPLHPPLAEQDEALDADQVNVATPPAVIELGPTLKLTVGAVADTVIVVDWVALPPGPVQVKVNVWLVDRLPVPTDPLSVLLPLQAPVAVHDVALDDDQLIVVAV
jgi:hypothetical protein